MTTIWSFPTKIRFGAGEAKASGEELGALHATRALIVTDPGVEGAGLCRAVLAAGESAGLALSVFNGVESNPTEANIAAGADAYKQHRAEAIVAIGGGSVMDASKLIALRAVCDTAWEELDDAVGGGKHVPEQVPPVIALPTTAGTGSEVGRAAVLTVESTGRKTVVFSPRLLPRVAILDPELTRSMPAKVTAATGFDALTHCVEAYLAQGDHPMADAIAVAGVDLVAKHLPRAVADGNAMDARGGMMKAAMMGAVAFQKGLGACHSLAHPLSSLCGLHHGLANALCLPAVIDFNEQVALEKVLHVSLLLGGDPEAGGCGRALRSFRATLGLPGRLRDAGVREDQLEPLADQAILDACHRENPRPCTREQLLELYKKSF